MINEVRLIGNVGGEPRMGNNVSRFSLATNAKWKDRNGDWQEETQWHYIVCFGFMDEYVRKYVDKGKQLYVEGSLMYGEYEKEGVTIRTAEIKAKKIKILGRMNEGGEYETPSYQHSTGEDVPF